MAKQRKLLTREQILSIPDAPKGQRACDDVQGEKTAAEALGLSRRIAKIEHLLENNAVSFTERFLQTRAMMYEAAEKLTGEKRSDFWLRALAVLKSTGLSVGEYNRLTWQDEIRVLRAAAKLKTHEQAELLAAMQGLLDKGETPAGGAAGTDWDRPDHKAAVCKWIRTQYSKNGRANKAGTIRAALVHFGLPADYERRVRTEYDKRQKK